MNPEKIRSQFPIFVKNRNLVYLDSASTTMIPYASVDAVSNFLSETVSSSRRGAHALAVRGASLVEETRKKLSAFLGTQPSQVSFQKSIPSAVTSFTLGYDWKKNKRDTILVAESEEHSILVPLQRVAQLLNLKIKSIPIDGQGNLQLEPLKNLLNERIGIVAVGTTTMGWGVRNPLSKISTMVHKQGALLLSDMSRSFAFDITESIQSGIDLAVFSGNTSLMSPPGLTIQWIDETLGNSHIPGIIGGSSVTNVNVSSYDIALQPDKFESGTLNVPAIAGLDASIGFLERIGGTVIKSKLRQLASYTLRRLKEIDALSLYGSPDEDTTIFGINLGEEDVMSCHDVALFLDESNIAVRSGLLCAHPLVKHATSEGIIQVSYSIYNETSDVDALSDTLEIISKDLL